MFYNHVIVSYTKFLFYVPLLFLIKFLYVPYQALIIPLFAPFPTDVNFTIYALWPHLHLFPLPSPLKSSRAPHLHHYYHVIIALHYCPRPWIIYWHTLIMKRTLDVQKNVSFWIFINSTHKQNQCHEHTPILESLSILNKIKLQC
jgi:hypothetical protein